MPARNSQCEGRWVDDEVKKNTLYAEFRWIDLVHRSNGNLKIISAAFFPVLIAISGISIHAFNAGSEI